MVKDQVYRFYRTIYVAATDTANTGLVNGDFTFVVIANGVGSADIVTATHIAGGKYKFEITPTKGGDYYIFGTLANTNVPSEIEIEEYCSTIDPENIAEKGAIAQDLDDVTVDLSPVQSQTDKLLFDANSYVKSNNQTESAVDTNAIATAVDAKITESHGSGSYVSSSSGSGTDEITITVYKTGTSTAIPDTKVLVYNVSNEIVAYGETDANGQVELMLNLNTAYTIKGQKSFVTYTEVAATFTSSSKTATMYGTIVSPSVPSAGLQTIYGNLKTLGFSSVASADVEASIMEQQAVSSAVISKQVVSTTTDSSGYFELAIVKGAEIKINIEKDRQTYSIEIDVTSDDTRDIVAYIND